MVKTGGISALHSRYLFVALAFWASAAFAALTEEDATRIGREANVEGLRALIAQHTPLLIYRATSAWNFGGSRELSPPLEALVVEHYADREIQRSLLSLLARAIDPQNEVAVLESTFDATSDSHDPKSKKPVDMPSYTIVVVHRNDDGQWFLSRKIIFTRDDLQPHRQIVYDKNGNVATDAHYDNFNVYGNLLFPGIITIWRPQEEYTVQIGIVKLTLNTPLRNDQFDLPQPPGSILVRLDNQPQPATSNASNPPGSR